MKHSEIVKRYGGQPPREEGAPERGNPGRPQQAPPHRRVIEAGNRSPGFAESRRDENVEYLPQRTRIANSAIAEDSPALQPYPEEIDWVPVPRSNRRYASFYEPGDTEHGRVISWDPADGERKYSSGEPCGYLDLWNFHEEEVVRITLDSGAKVSAVQAVSPQEGTLLAFSFVEFKKSKKSGEQWKDYMVYLGTEKA